MEHGLTNSSEITDPGKGSAGPEIAVLLMAYGGPGSLADVAPYLQDVRGGRPTPPELLGEMEHRYQRIGGRSPLLEITRRQAQALEWRLNRDALDGKRDPTDAQAVHAGQGNGEPAAGPASHLRFPAPYRVYVGMRHWHPYIHETVGQMAQDGAQKVVALCMAPHYSRMSVGAYFQKLDEATAALGTHLDISRIEDWHAHPLFIQALAERAREAWGRFGEGVAHHAEGLRRHPEGPGKPGRDLGGPSEDRPASGQVRFLFTAHSLPASIVEEGDPYEAELLETCSLLAGQLGLPGDRWQFCYQSAGATGARWLGPKAEDVLVELCDAGHKDIVVVPVGFVADHVEVLYDIDVVLRELAAVHGAHLERAESLNTCATFIAGLADLVRGATGA